MHNDSALNPESLRGGMHYNSELNTKGSGEF